MRKLLTTVATLPLALSLGVASAAVEDLPPTPESVLEAAFANRYDVDLITNIELVMRNRAGQERRRKVHGVSKIIDDRMHSIGRLTWPNYLRGMTILTIESEDRSHDSFVYLPSLDKVRRISTAQKADSFFGSDVTYEDLERRRVNEFDIQSLEEVELEGEPAYRVLADAVGHSSYARVIFFVARSDGAILETRYFKRGQETPYRVIVVPRSGMIERKGHVLPTRMTVHNHTRGTTTDVVFNDLVVNPPIDSKVFSVRALEQERNLPRADPEQQTGE